MKFSVLPGQTHNQDITPKDHNHHLCSDKIKGLLVSLWIRKVIMFFMLLHSWTAFWNLLGIQSKYPFLFLGSRAPTYLLLPLGKWGSKWGDFHGQWGVFNHEKGAIWQSHLAAQKEGVVSTIIFSNHKTF